MIFGVFLQPLPFVQFEDKHDAVGFQIYSFSTFDRIKKWDENVNGKSAEKPYFIEAGSTARTINLTFFRFFYYSKK